MHLRKYVRQIRPIQENYIKPEDKVQNLLSEAYSFFPKSEEEISKTLSDFPHEKAPAPDFLSLSLRPVPDARSFSLFGIVMVILLLLLLLLLL